MNGAVVATTSNPTFVIDSATYPTGAQICVTTTNANGCIATECVTVGGANGGPAFGGPCQAYFEIFPDTGLNGTGVPGDYIGYNRSTGNYGTDLLWDFGDGGTSPDAYPIHNYASPGNYVVCLTVGLAGTNCFDTYCDSSFYAFKTEGGLMSHLAFSNPNGINETANNIALRVYPNPVSNELSIESSTKLDLVRIFNLNGQKMFESKAVNNKINLSKLAAGVYVLEVSAGNKI